MKIGDYETAEFALKEFIDKNKDHDLAEAHNIGTGKLRIRQLYLMQQLHILMDIKISKK